jgi:glycolate dehydrogenase iron-sulfur subunit
MAATAMLAGLRGRLEEVVGRDHVRTDEGALVTFSTDATPLERARPDAVVFPATAEEVAEVLRIANEQGIPVVPRGSGESECRDGSAPRRHRARVDADEYLMLGCFERVLYPRVSRDARELAAELAAPVAQGCCGAQHAHNGELGRGEELAKELAKELGEALPGTIVTTSGGCAAHLAGVLGTERVKELSQWLLARDGAAAGKPGDGRLRIGLQDSCHLRNGLGVWREPRELIARVGEYVELPSAAACCGAAGSYAVVRPKNSARVLDPHLDEIADADLDVIVVVNAGCYWQLEQGVKRRGLRTRVVHLAELLAGEK